MDKRKPTHARRGRGFRKTAALVEQRIRAVGESRGFAVSRLLTHWAEIVGDETARIARPVDVRYGRGAFGATLTVLTTGASAPIVEMSREQIRARVNACYGYAAISRIRITQTAPTGFAEGAVAFGPAPAPAAAPVAPEMRAAAEAAARPFADSALRDAIAALAQNVFAFNRSPK